jgi:PhzF family phenazine biosynthesis protein
MEVKVRIINAFSVQNKGGNPAGIVLEADQLSAQQKQLIASRLGFPETAFVSQSPTADFKLDFFTPTKQIPHCGHATIAAFSYLKQIGKVLSQKSSKETIDGNREIVYKDAYAFMEQRAPTFLTPENEQLSILQSLGITSSDLKDGLLPTIVNTGNSFLIIPVKNESELARLEPNMKQISEISAPYNLIGYYVYAPSENKILQATARMFAPYYGIDEESATGMAAGPLACFLYEKENIKSTQMLSEQGRFMTPPSLSQIHVHLDIVDGQISRLFAGGDAYVSGEQILEL